MKTNLWTVGQHINGITINPLEHLLESKNGEVMTFETKEEALQFLKSKGFTSKQIYNLVIRKDFERGYAVK